MVLNTLDPEELVTDALHRYKNEKGLGNKLTLSIETVEEIADSVIVQILKTLNIETEEVCEEIIEELREILDEVRLNLYKRGTISIAPPPEEN